MHTYVAFLTVCIIHVFNIMLVHRAELETSRMIDLLHGSFRMHGPTSVSVQCLSVFMHYFIQLAKYIYKFMKFMMSLGGWGGGGGG